MPLEMPQFFEFHQETVRIMKRTLGAILCLFIFFCSIMAQNKTEAKPAPKLTYIRAGRLFDSTADSAKSNMVIVVEGDRIKQVAPAADVNIPAGATVVDLPRATVLPGLIDCHT